MHSGEDTGLRAQMLWGACDFLFATDRPAMRLGDDLRVRALKAGRVCLSTYSALSAKNLSSHRINYKLRPKWCLDKFVLTVRKSKALLCPFGIWL